MNTSADLTSPNAPAMPNGSGAAAILSAGISAFTLAVLAVGGDKSVLMKRSLNFYTPTGPLSGVTTVAILVWIFTWAILEWRWRRKTLAMGRISVVALALLCLSLLMTFPPIVDIF
jgi:hypothetical protein